MQKKAVLVFLLFFLLPLSRFSQNKPPELIIWRMGQGQMVTYSDPIQCVHFDMGGEYFPLKDLKKECRRKKNKVFFSHWDWDHINFAKKAWKNLFYFCRLNEPGGKGNNRKKKFLFSIPKCRKSKSDIFKEITFSARLNKKKSISESNKHSRVIVVKNQVLIPGDSPGSSEKLWMHKITNPIRVLVLSHHGSRYSTTSALLKKLKYLKIATASARKKRYGHPHPLLKKRLSKIGVPLLGTEEFHHIRIPLIFWPNRPIF